MTELNPAAPRLGHVNALLLASARRHHVRDFAGPLSIKYVLDGRVAWRVGRRELLVDPCSFLVLHDGEPYSMELDERRPVRTCCPFFQRGFLEVAARSVSAEESALLDQPESTGTRLEFLAQLHRDDARIVPRLHALAAAFRGTPDPLWVDETFLELARELAMLHGAIRLRAARLPAARVSTRVEAMRRLNRAVEFIHAHADEPLTINRIAREACLSQFHFHRLFSAAYHESAHAYVRRLRLDRARRLLASGRIGVTEVCAEVGFASLGSFSALFRRHFGLAPSEISRIREAR